LPFQPGRYLFATDFVDARTGTLRILPTKDLSDFKGTHMHTNNAYTHTQLNFVFGNVTEQFVIRGQEAAQTAINAFWDDQKALSAAAQAQDWPAVEKVDPFFECRRLGTWGSATPQPPDGGPQVKTVPPFFRRRAVVAAVAAIVLAPLIALGRNFVSDQMMFAKAKQIDSESSYGQYIDHGWRHISEAKLAQPIAAFREAKKDATVSKMRHVLKTYPGSSVESDVRAALHGLYMKTFSDFRARASTAGRAHAAVHGAIDRLSGEERHRDRACRSSARPAPARSRRPTPSSSASTRAAERSSSRSARISSRRTRRRAKARSCRA
jgi:hypothetical protein